jgi:hypothetical protein
VNNLNRSDITQERCFNHREREAVARCPECSRFFCRECVTEHDDRVICAACLKRILSNNARGNPRLLSASLLLQLAAGFMLLWLLFYGIGQALLKITSPVHEKTLWKQSALTPHEKEKYRS